MCEESYPTTKSCLAKLKRLFKSYVHVKVSKVNATLFLHLGTDESSTGWVNEKGEDLFFNYIDWKTVASGSDEATLLQSARRYARVCKMSPASFYVKEFNLKGKAATSFRKMFSAVNDLPEIQDLTGA